MRITSLTGALLIVALTIPAAGRAADAPKKESNSGTGKAAGGILTKDQLRACRTQHERRLQQDDALSKEKATLAATQDEIARSGEALKAKLTTLDRSDAEAVAAYNDQTQARDRQIDDFEARANAFNAGVKAADAERDTYRQACANRRFLEEDETAIRKGK